MARMNGRESNLHKARASLGMNQEQFARATGTRREMISYYETGKRKIPESFALLCENLFGIPSDYILGSRDAGKDWMKLSVSKPNAAGKYLTATLTKSRTPVYRVLDWGMQTGFYVIEKSGEITKTRVDYWTIIQPLPVGGYDET